MAMALRPRERLWQLGVQRVSDEELVGILLGTGVRGRSVWNVAQDVVTAAGGLAALAHAAPQELVQTVGIGAGRATRMVAAFELGRRALAPLTPPTVKSAEDIARLLTPKVAGLTQEAFFVVALDVRNQVISIVEIARGTLVGVEVHPREVFRPLIRIAAAGAVLAHNHPSGDPTPSRDDVELTARLRAVGELIGIPIVDHIVVAGTRHRSIAEWSGGL